MRARRRVGVLVFAALAAISIGSAVAAGPTLTKARNKPTRVLPERRFVDKLDADTRLQYLSLFTARLPNLSKLTVWNGFEGDMAGYGAGPQFVDWHRELLSWKFIWTNGVNNAVSGQWQLIRWGSTGEGDDWRHPPGLVASGPVAPAPAAMGQRYVTIDFTNYVPNPDGSPRNGLILEAIPVQPKAKAHDIRRELKPAKRAEVGGARSRALAVPVADFVLTPAPPMYHTFFVRVVPLDAQGERAGAATDPVMITFGEPNPPTPVDLSPGGLGHPTWMISRYQPVRPFAPDCLCIYIVGQNILNPMTHEVMIAAGTVFDACAPEDDGGIVSDFADAVGGFVDALGSFVSWGANIYNSAKATLLSAVIQALQSTVGCGGECQLLVGAALDAGLAAVGLPPSLPDYDQLLSMGTDYLACTIAAEAGIPEEVARAGMDAMVEAAHSSAATGGGAITYPDPMRQYRPLALVLEMKNGSGAATQPVNLVLKEKSGKLYAIDPVPVPSIPAGGSLRVPVFPRPIVDPAAWLGLLPTAQDAMGSLSAFIEKQKQAMQALADWTRDYTEGGVTFTVATIDPIGKTAVDQGKVVCEAGSSRCVPTY